MTISDCERGPGARGRDSPCSDSSSVRDGVSSHVIESLSVASVAGSPIEEVGVEGGSGVGVSRACDSVGDLLGEGEIARFGIFLRGDGDLSGVRVGSFSVTGGAVGCFRLETTSEKVLLGKGGSLITGEVGWGKPCLLG